MLRLAMLIALGACSDPGWIRGPIGGTPIRTAQFRVATRDNRSELLLFLSNGAYPACYLPGYDDLLELAIAGDDAVVATCREGAQHLLLTAYSTEDEFSGVFVNSPDGRPGDVGIALPPIVRAQYFGVREAILLEANELLRRYLATEWVTLDPVPGVGELVLQPNGDDVLQGTVVLDGDALGSVSASFSAERCEGDTSLLERADETWLSEFCTL